MGSNKNGVAASDQAGSVVLQTLAEQEYGSIKAFLQVFFSMSVTMQDGSVAIPMAMANEWRGWLSVEFAQLPADKQADYLARAERVNAALASALS